MGIKHNGTKLKSKTFSTVVENVSRARVNLVLYKYLSLQKIYIFTYDIILIFISIIYI